MYIFAHGAQQRPDYQAPSGRWLELISTRGSHHKLRKGGVTVIVPHPKKDLPIGTARSIAKAVGWI